MRDLCSAKLSDNDVCCTVKSENDELCAMGKAKHLNQSEIVYIEKFFLVIIMLNLLCPLCLWVSLFVSLGLILGHH